MLHSEFLEQFKGLHLKCERVKRQLNLISEAEEDGVVVKQLVLTFSNKSGTKDGDVDLFLLEGADIDTIVSIIKEGMAAEIESLEAQMRSLVTKQFLSFQK